MIVPNCFRHTDLFNVQENNDNVEAEIEEEEVERVVVDIIAQLPIVNPMFIMALSQWSNKKLCIENYSKNNFLSLRNGG